MGRSLAETQRQPQTASRFRRVCGWACALDLHALVPVPDGVLCLGPDHPEALAWLWTHWGTTAALRLPPLAEACQPRRLPFWGIGDATTRITRLLQECSEGRGLEAFLPEIAEAGSGRTPQCRAAVAATFMAGLELARGGALTLQQDTAWQPVQVHRRHDTSPGNAST